MKFVGMQKGWSFVFLAFVFSLTFSVYGQYGGGTGAADDPYIISEPNHLQAIGANPSDWNKCFMMTADIDLSQYDGQEGRPFFNCIGSSNNRFNGTFNGNGKTIHNFTYVKLEDYIGIFRCVGDDGIIQNLTMANVNINGGYYDYIGGIAGYNYGVIYNCYLVGSIHGESYVGGLVGYNSGIISFCEVIGTIDGDNYTGGLVGKNYRSYVSATENISFCNYYGDVYGTDYIGGLVGDNKYCALAYCHTSGNVTGTSSCIGGVVGYVTDSQIRNCYSTAEVAGGIIVGGILGCSYSSSIYSSYSLGTVTGDNEIGGLTGKNLGSICQSYAGGNVNATGNSVGGLAGVNCGNITDCYAYGYVQGRTNVGGLAGYNYNGDTDTITNSYAVGHVAATSSNAGGFVGYNIGDIKASFWDIDTSGLNQGIGFMDSGQVEVSGKITPAMMQEVTFSGAGWDFADIWTIVEGNDYPRHAGFVDLAVFHDTSFIVESGQTLYLPIQVVNKGTTGVNSEFITKIYYSENSAVDWNELNNEAVFKEYSLDAIPASSHRMTMLSLNFPDRVPGTSFYLRAKTDATDQIAESEEGNNWGPVMQFNVDGPDLAAYFDNEIYSEVAPGQTIDISVRIENQGGNNAGTFSVTVYLTDAFPVDWNTPADNLIIGHLYFDSLVVGKSSSKTIPITVPMGSSIYFLRVEVDPNNDIVEKNENNNLSEIIALGYNYDYGGGMGTREEPYQIWTAEQLYSLTLIQQDWDKSFVLMEDIDLVELGEVPFRSIGKTRDNYFAGIFDGTNHIIRNFTLTPNDEASSLFGYVSGGGIIRNLGLLSINIESNDNYVAGLVGILGDEEPPYFGTVRNCYVTGTIICYDHYAVGGLVCYMDYHGSIINSYAEINIEDLSNNENYAYDIGGLVGFGDGTINSCYAEGKITINKKSRNIGGLVGNSEGNIINCYSDVDITVNGDGDDIGGLIGYGDGLDVSQCYAVGKVLVTNPIYEVGGLIGEGYRADACFWDIETTGQTAGEAGQGLSTASMMQKSTFVDAGWTFVEENEDGIWTMIDGADYPKLAALYKYSGGRGTAAEPYQVSSILDLFMVREKPASCFVLANNIDLEGFARSTAIAGRYPDRPFTGVFDGNGHIVSNFTLAGGVENQSGFFGYVSGPAASIQNLGLKDVTIEANVASHIGGLIGYNDQASMANCYVTGNIIGWDSVGGLIGYNEAGAVSNCYTAGSVQGMWFTGGAVGCNWQGDLIHMYSATEVSGFGAAGGLAGYDQTGTYVSCFWDYDVSHQSNGLGNGFSLGITPKATADMMEKDTYLNAGWDFAGEEANGNADIWDLHDSIRDYPRLAWEYLPGDVAGSVGVDLTDFAVFANSWLATESDAHWNPDCDLYQDGVIDSLDLAVLAGEWLEN